VTLFRSNVVQFLIVVAPLLVGRHCLAVPSFAPGIQTGNIQNSAVNEASGIAASRFNANVLWTHDDSGNPAQIFPMTPAGTNLGTYTVSGTSNVDWEDIAVGPGPMGGTQYLYVGDIGDNNAVRSNISVYRLPEPVVSHLQSPVSTSLAGAVKLTFAYPDGPRDAESLFVDPLNRDIYIISKRENPHHVYRAAYPQPTSGTTTLELVKTFNDPNWLTAADISLDGDEIIARGTSSSSGRMWIRPPGGSIADAFGTSPISIPLVSDGQGEAIGFDPAGWGYYTTSEGTNRPIHYFNRLTPPGDFNGDGVVDLADYVVWRKGLGTTYTPDDYDDWRASFGAAAGSGLGANSDLPSVPEPATITCLLLGVMLVDSHCRHHFRRP
jgi:hypothetical protein